MQILIGLIAGVLIDGLVTMGAIKMLKKWNRETLEKATNDFETVIDEKINTIIKTVVATILTGIKTNKNEAINDDTNKTPTAK